MRFDFTQFIISMLMPDNETTKTTKGIKILTTALHLTILTASAIMIVWVSEITLKNMSFLNDRAYMHFQLWMCLLFLGDILVETVLAKHRFRFLLKHSLFILVCIPWLNLFEAFGITVPERLNYLVRLLPLLRAGYVLALVSGALTSRKQLSMLWVYIIWVLVAVYFAGLMFFVEEHKANPMVDTFWTALWWAFLDMTTCGTNITPVTAVGKALSVALPIFGLTLFPVFTVYITNGVMRMVHSKK